MKKQSTFLIFVILFICQNTALIASVRCLKLTEKILYSSKFPTFKLSNATEGAFETSHAHLGGHYGVTWYENLNGMQNIKLRLLHYQELKGGRWTVSPPSILSIPNENSLEPHIVATNDGFAITWYTKNKAEGSGKIYLAQVDLNGKLLTRQMIHQGKNARNSLLLWNGKHFALSWIENNSIYASIVDKKGKIIQSPYKIGLAASNTWNLTGKFQADGQLFIASDYMGVSIIRANKHLKSAKQIIVKDRVLEHARYPDLYLIQNRWAITWFSNKNKKTDIFFSWLDGNFRPKKIQNISNTGGESQGAYMSWQGDEGVIVWLDNFEGSSNLYYRVYRDGRFYNTKKITHNPNYTGVASINWHDKCFSLSWNDLSLGEHSQDFSKSQVFFQIICP